MLADIPFGGWIRGIVLGVSCAALAIPLSGQSSVQEGIGSLRGRALDSETGAPVGGALIRLRDVSLFRLTDAQGEFHFAALEEGDYQLVVSAPGFQDPGLVSVSIQAGETTSVDILLKVEAFKLPALVVTADRGAAGYGESVASVDVVSSVDLQRHSAITVDAALRFASGVTFNARQIDIRGSSGMSRGVGSRVLLMVGGHRFLSGTTGETSFEAIPIVGVERVEVVKGPGSTLYGSNALGGVVNVIRSPIPEEPETLARAYLGFYDSPDEFSFSTEPLNFQGLDLRHARQVGRVGIFGEVGLKTSDGFRQNGNYDRNFVHGGFSVLRDEGLPLLEVFGLWSGQTRGEFFVWSDPDRPLEVDPEELGDRIDAEKVHVGATYVPVTTADLVVQVRGGLYRDETQNYFHDNQDFHLSTRYSLDAQASLYPWRGQTLTLGLEGAYTPVESNFLGRPRLYDAAVFAQEDFRLSQTFRAIAGLRGDFHDTNSGDPEVTLNPKVGFVYSPLRRGRYRASLSRGYRAPSATEQFVSSSQFGFHVVPNPELKGESAWAVEVGASGSPLEWAFLEASLFQTNFHDLIGPAPLPGGPFGTFQFRNVSEAQVRGLDSSLRVGFLDQLVQGQVNYLLLDTEDKLTGEPLPYRSRHNVTVSADAGPVGADFQYRSRVEQVLAFPLDPRDHIMLVGLRLGFRLAGVSGQLKLANLLQESYVDIQERTPGPSRSLQLTLQSIF